MSDQFVCPFEDAVVYKIPDNIAPTLGSGSAGWTATGAGVTHAVQPRMLNDNDCLSYGTPENATQNMPITKVTS